MFSKIGQLIFDNEAVAKTSDFTMGFCNASSANPEETIRSSTTSGSRSYRGHLPHLLDLP